MHRKASVGQKLINCQQLSSRVAMIGICVGMTVEDNFVLEMMMMHKCMSLDEVGNIQRKEEYSCQTYKFALKHQF